MARDQVFISYSRKDKDWLERLQTMLVPLARTGFKICGAARYWYGPHGRSLTTGFRLARTFSL